jgi:hypothetical protein
VREVREIGGSTKVLVLELAGLQEQAYFLSHCVGRRKKPAKLISALFKEGAIEVGKEVNWA